MNKKTKTAGVGRHDIHKQFFTCPECGHHVVEEIASGATISYDVEDIELAADGVDLRFYYSQEISVADMDTDSIRWQCGECGKKVTEAMLKVFAARQGYPVFSTIGYHGREGEVAEYLDDGVVVRFFDTGEEKYLEIEDFLEQQT